MYVFSMTRVYVAMGGCFRTIHALSEVVLDGQHMEGLAGASNCLPYNLELHR